MIGAYDDLVFVGGKVTSFGSARLINFIVGCGVEISGVFTTCDVLIGCMFATIRGLLHW